MCLATPVKVLKLAQNKATVDASGEEAQVDVSLLKGIRVGDYLYASRGLAIRKVSRGDAKEVLKIVRNWND